jgi:DNA-binding transcriptional LysR family regulator
VVQLHEGATNEGKQLFSSAKAMIAAAEKGLEAMHFHTKEPNGTLNLSVPSILTRSSLIEDIAAFSEKYSKVTLTISFSDEPKDLIREGFDAVIRIGQLEDSSMKTVKIFTIERKLVLSKKLLKNKPILKKPDELMNYKWIGFRMLPNYRVLIHRDGTKFKANFNPTIIVDSVDSACQLAKSGAGLFTPPSFLIEHELQSGALIEILPNWRLQSLDTYFLWHANASKTGLSSLFRDFLLDRQRFRTSQK